MGLNLQEHARKNGVRPFLKSFGVLYWLLSLSASKVPGRPIVHFPAIVFRLACIAGQVALTQDKE
jgi:hypothetical protein